MEKPKEAKRVKLKPGDTVILQGDSRAVLGNFPDDSIDLTFTSPPYPEFSPELKVKSEEWANWMLPFMKQLERVTKNTGSVVVNVGDYPRLSKPKYPWVEDFVLTTYKNTDLKLIHRLIWFKRFASGGANGKLPKISYEFCFWFAKDPKQVKANFWNAAIPASEETIKKLEQTPDRRAKTGAKKHIEYDYRRVSHTIEKHGGKVLPYDIVEVGITGSKSPWRQKMSELKEKYGKDIGRYYVFPYKLPLFFILCLTDPGDVVLDPFMGTGTTIIAAVKNDRIGIGIDVDPHAVALAKIRVKERLE